MEVKSNLMQAYRIAQSYMNIYGVTERGRTFGDEVDVNFSSTSHLQIQGGGQRKNFRPKDDKPSVQARDSKVSGARTGCEIAGYWRQTIAITRHVPLACARLMFLTDKRNRFRAIGRKKKQADGRTDGGTWRGEQQAAGRTNQTNRVAALMGGVLIELLSAADG